MMTTAMKRTHIKAQYLFYVVLAMLLLVFSARAVDYIWDGTSSADWGNKYNWVSEPEPTFNDQVNVIFYIDSPTYLTTCLGSSNRTIGSLTFNANATKTVRIRLTQSITSTTARHLYLGSATVAPVIIAEAGPSANHYIGDAGGNVVLKNNLTVTKSSSGYLYINRPITGDYGITKEGGGALWLNGNNTYTGKTVINSGKIVIEANTAFGANPVSVVADQVILNGGGFVYDKTVSSLGNRGITLGAKGGTIESWSGATDRTLTINTPIAGSGALTKNGAGTLTLTGNNTYSGGTTVKRGFLRAGHNNALGTGSVRFNGATNRLIIANNVTITNSITLEGGTGGVGRGLIENDGAGGNATITGGTLTITGNSTAGGHFATFGAGGSLTFACPIIASPNVTLVFRDGTGIFSGGGTYGNFIVNLGTIRLGADNGLSTSATLSVGASGAFTLDLAGFNQQLVSIRKAANTATIGNNSGAGISTLTITGTNTYSGIIQDTLGTPGGTVALTVNGGEFTLTGANSYTGPTTITAGTLQLGEGGTDGALSPASTISVAETALFVVNRSDTVTQGTDFSSAPLTGTGGLTLSGTGTTILTATNSYAGPTTVNAGTLQLGNDGRNGSLNTASTITIATNASFAVNRSDTVTQGTDFSSVPLTGAGGFTQAGRGTTILTATNSYTGPTTVTAGTLQLAAADTLPAASPVVLAGGTLTLGGVANAADTLTVTGDAAIDLGTSGSLTFADSSPTAWTGTLVLTGTLGATTLRFGTDSNALTPDQLSRISSNGKRVSLDASGYLVESSTAYTFYWDNNGSTSGFGVAGGTWAAPTLNQWSFSADGTATPEASAETFTFLPVNFGTASAGLGAGAITVSGTVQAGSLQFGSASETVTLDSGAIVLGESATITVNTTTGLVSSVLGGAAAAFAKEGDGTLVLSGANTFTGATTVNDGILEIGSAPALQNSPLDTSGSVAGSDTEGIRTTVTSLILGGLTGNQDLDALFTTASGGYGNLANIVLNIPSGVELNYEGAIADGAEGMALIKKGAGTQTLAGASTATGNLRIEAGTVKLSAGNRLAAASGLEIAANAAPTATLDLNGFDQTLERFVFLSEDSSGQLKVTGQPDSTLTVNALADTGIGPCGAISGYRTVTADLSGLDAFVWKGTNVRFRVGPQYGTNPGGDPGTSTVLLARQNTLAAARIELGQAGLNNHGGTSFLRLGQSNMLHTDTLNIGCSGRSFATLNFQAGLETPWARLRGTDGISAVGTWDIGKVATYNATTWTATADFTGGELDVLVTSLRIGMADTTGNTTPRMGIQNSFFKMEKGTLEVTTLSLGLLLGHNNLSVSQNGTFQGNGTFTLSHAEGLVKAESLLLGVKDNNFTLNSGSTAKANGTFNLQAGALEAATIGRGTQIGAGTTTQTFNFSGGTVRNRAESDLAIDNVPINLTGSGIRIFEATEARTITVGAPITGAGGFTKRGVGTLVLAAANTYTGETRIEAGTLALDAHDASTANSTLTLAGGTLSAGSYTNTLGLLTVTGTTTLDLGDGTGSLSFPDCSGSEWTGAVALTGRLGATTLRFGTNADALTPEQLSSITLRGCSVKITDEGYIACIPGTLIQFF